MTTAEPTQRTFLNLAVPNVLTNLTVPLAGFIDMALLGHLDDLTPLAGVALGTLIFDFLYWSLGFLRMGTTGLTARAFGANDRQDSAEIFFRSMMVALIIGVLVLLCMNWVAALGFGLMDGGAEVEAQGLAYFFARAWGAPATLAGYVLTGWLLGRQKSKYVLVFAVTLNFLNIFFDWLFIYEFGWGAAGAGYATMLAEVLACLLGIFLVRLHWGEHPGFRFAYLLDKKNLFAMLGLHWNIMIRTFCLISSFALFTNVSASMGTVVLAGNTILLRLLNTAAYFIDGFAFALESLAGRFDGAGDWQAVRRSLRMALVWNLAAVALFSVLFLTAGGFFLGLLTVHEDVIVYGTTLMPFVAGSLLLAGFAYIYDGFFIGLAKGALLRNAMIVSLLAGFVPWVWAAKSLGSPTVLWWGMVSFMFFRAFTLGRHLWDRNLSK